MGIVKLIFASIAPKNATKTLARDVLANVAIDVVMTSMRCAPIVV